MMPLVSTTLTAAIGSSSSQHPLPPPPPIKIKKKRNVGGNPDPDATVVALSPRTLLEPNQFLCEICYKTFVREQNMQMHYRSHNREWKLGAREKVKRAFVCPDESCVHHHPSRALCDFSAIRKHYIRKHGEKKWKCQTCPKAYAVEGDLKAHAKICGSKHYKCDRCTYTAYRKDSFANHKKWCNELPANLGIMPTTIPHPQTSISYQSLLHPLMPNMLGSIPDHFSTASMFPPVVSKENYTGPINTGFFGVGDLSTTSQFPPVLPSENYPGDNLNPAGSFGVGDFSSTPFFPPVLPSETTPFIPPVPPSENYPGDNLNPAGPFGVGDFSTASLFPPIVSSENHTGDALNHGGVEDFASAISFIPPDVSLENFGDLSPFLPGTSFDMTGGTVGEGASSQDLGGLPPLPESLEIPSLAPENASSSDVFGFPWPNWN